MPTVFTKDTLRASVEAASGGKLQFFMMTKVIHHI